MTNNCVDRGYMGKSEKGNQYQKKLLWRKMISTINKLKSRCITNKMVKYVINCILISQLEYLVTDFIPPERFMEKIDRKISVLRRKCTLSKVFPLVGIYRIIKYNIFFFKDGVLARTASKFLARLNKNQSYRIITKIRLQTLQNKL